MNGDIEQKVDSGLAAAAGCLLTSVGLAALVLACAVSAKILGS